MEHQTVRNEGVDTSTGQRYIFIARSKLTAEEVISEILVARRKKEIAVGVKSGDPIEIVVDIE